MPNAMRSAAEFTCYSLRFSPFLRSSANFLLVGHVPVATAAVHVGGRGQRQVQLSQVPHLLARGRVEALEAGRQARGVDMLDDLHDNQISSFSICRNFGLIYRRSIPL